MSPPARAIGVAAPPAGEPSLGDGGGRTRRGRARPGRVDGGETWTACRVAVPDRDSSRMVVLDRATCARLLASVGLGRLRVLVRPGRPPAVVLRLAGRDVPLARHLLGLRARDGCRVRFRNGDRLDLRVANLDLLVPRGHRAPVAERSVRPRWRVVRLLGPADAPDPDGQLALAPPGAAPRS